MYFYNKFMDQSNSNLVCVIIGALVGLVAANNGLLEDIRGVNEDSPTRSTRSRRSTRSPKKIKSSKKVKSTNISSLVLNADSVCSICLDTLFSKSFKSYTCDNLAMHAIHEDCLNDMQKNTDGSVKSCKLCVTK